MADGPKKSRKWLIIGIVAVVLIVIVVAVAGMFLLGGACCLGSFIFSSSTETTGNALVEESQQIPYTYYLYYDYIEASAGDTIEISVTTDGSPVDVMIMTADQFSDYEDAVDGYNDGTWYTMDTITSVVSRTITYDVTAYDTYYVVFDNTEDPTGGADSGQSVDLDVVISVKS